MNFLKNELHQIRLTIKQFEEEFSKKNLTTISFSEDQISEYQKR